MSIKVGKVAMIKRSKIIIGERARKDMGDLTSLETSMTEREMIQPIAVIDNEDSTYELLTGGRRMAVLEKHEVDVIPCRIYTKDISEHERKSIELAENLYRKNFEYYEHDALVAQIHALQQQAHGVKLGGPGTGWGLAETGELIGKSKGSISSALKRAEARDKFPELFSTCKDQKDAMKVMSKISDLIVREEVAKRIEENKTGVVNDLAKRYILKDFFEGVKEIPDNTYNWVEIDPPYAIDLKNAKKTTDGKAIQEHDYNEIPAKEYKRFLTRLFKECYRVMAPDSWLICWFGPEPWFESVYDSLIKANFSVKRIPGLWAKPSGQSKRPYEYLGNAYEMFFYAKKGEPKLHKPGRSNIFQFNQVPPNAKTHPTERPIEMIKEVLDTFAAPNSKGLVPFLGSGNTLLAAYELGMESIGFELGKSFKDSFLIKVNKKYSG